MAIDYIMFVKKIVEYVQDKKLSNLSQLAKQKCSDKNSCWGKITQSILGKFDRKISLQLFSAWKKNNKNIKNKVIKLLGITSTVMFKFKTITLMIS